MSQNQIDSIAQSLYNKLNLSLNQHTVHDGVIKLIDDNPTGYLKDGYTGNDDVYSIINRPIQMQTQARLCLYTTDSKGKWVEVFDHELNRFLFKVNPKMTMNDFRKAFLIYKFNIGNSFWYKPTIENGINKGKAIEIYTMPSNNVRLVDGKSWMDSLGGYVLELNTSVLFAKEDVYHSKYFNPLFGTNQSDYGLSPLKAAVKTISKQNQGNDTELKQFENQAPPLLLMRDGVTEFSQLTDEQAKAIEDDFKDYAKYIKAGRIKVLKDKFAKIDLGISPVNLGILESSREGRRKLCNILCLPSELFNDKEASTYNNMIEARKAAWTDCIIPNLTDFSTSLTDFLINPIEEYKKEKLFFEWDLTQVQELQKDKATMIVWMKQAGYTPNEMREATGVNPIDNPLMNEPWMPMGEQPLSMATDNGDLPPLDPNAQKKLTFNDYK